MAAWGRPKGVKQSQATKDKISAAVKKAYLRRKEFSRFEQASAMNDLMEVKP